MSFMATSLIKLVDNLTEEIHKIKYRECDCFAEYESVKGNSIKYKFWFCDKDCLKRLDEDLK